MELLVDYRRGGENMNHVNMEKYSKLINQLKLIMKKREKASWQLGSGLRTITKVRNPLVEDIKSVSTIVSSSAKW